MMKFQDSSGLFPQYQKHLWVLFFFRYFKRSLEKKHQTTNEKAIFRKRAAIYRKAVNTQDCFTYVNAHYWAGQPEHSDTVVFQRETFKTKFSLQTWASGQTSPDGFFSGSQIIEILLYKSRKKSKKLRCLNLSLTASGKNLPSPMDTKRGQQNS